MDILTFQNRSLRDRAKRFEEALRRSTDEQIVVLFFMFFYVCVLCVACVCVCCVRYLGVMHYK